MFLTGQDFLEFNSVLLSFASPEKSVCSLFHYLLMAEGKVRRQA